MKKILLRTLKIMLIFLAGAAARFAAIAITVFVLVYKLSIADLLFFPVMAVVIALGIYVGFLVGRISEKKLRLPRMAGGRSIRFRRSGSAFGFNYPEWAKHRAGEIILVIYVRQSWSRCRRGFQVDIVGKCTRGCC